MKFHVDTQWLCLGHPAWPSGLVMRSSEDARAWFAEHFPTHPGISVVERTVTDRPLDAR